MNRFTHRRRSGFTLVEVIVAIGIFAVVTLALYIVIALALNVLRDDQSRLDALAMAQATIEEIRNVPYDDVGTTTGVPVGFFPSEQSMKQNNVTYTILTDIRYVDDIFDGQAPADTVNTDYKKVRVEVTWEGQFLDKPVILITTIVPQGIESNVGGGTLWIEVYDSTGTPIEDAHVAVTNGSTLPPISINSFTDENGRYILPGAPVATESYHVVVSKNGYSSSQTYSVDENTNPNPDPEDLTVLESEITTKTMVIDTLSSLNIAVTDITSGASVQDLPLRIYGEKRIGTNGDGNNISKYTTEALTSATGIIALNNLEYDTYHIDIQDPSFDFAGNSPQLPLVIAPGSTVELNLSVAPNAEQTLLITVTDSNEAVIANASVHLAKDDGSIDLTQATTSGGQTFFTPLTPGQYTLSIIAGGYNNYNGTLTIVADDKQTIPLALSGGFSL